MLAGWRRGLHDGHVQRLLHVRGGRTSRTADRSSSTVCGPDGGIYGGHYIGLYAAARAANQNCEESILDGVGVSSADLAAWLATLHGLSVSARCGDGRWARRGGGRRTDAGYTGRASGREGHRVALLIGSGSRSSTTSPGRDGGAPLPAGRRRDNIVIEVLDVPSVPSTLEYQAVVTEVIDTFQFGG